MKSFQQHSYALVPLVVSRVGLWRFSFLSSNISTRWCPQWCRVGMSQITSFQQHSYTLVPLVVSRVGVSRLTFFVRATFLHAGAHSGVACRNVATEKVPETLLYAGAHSGVACRSVALDVFFLQHSYTLVPTVVSRVGMSQMTSSQQRSVALDGFFVPATLLHAGALSGVACRSVALHVFVQQHFYTLVPTVVSRVGMSQITFFQQHSYTLVPVVVSRVGVSRLTFFSCNIPTRWCPLWCRVICDIPTRDTTVGTSV